MSRRAVQVKLDEQLDLAIKKTKRFDSKKLILLVLTAIALLFVGKVAYKAASSHTIFPGPRPAIYHVR